MMRCLVKFKRALVRIVVLGVLTAAWGTVLAEDCVILLHGMVRTASSMNAMEQALQRDGFIVANIGYPSRDHPVEKLAPMAVEQGLAQCADDDTVHFVTHSLGGILVRFYLGANDIPNLGRIVMLAPPNKGSEVVDKLKNMPGFEALNGPAGMQLGTDGLPATLGAVDYEVGIIAGTETINFILSQFLPNPDDGKVSVENTKLEGMTDFVTVPHSHPFIMDAPAVIDHTISFLRSGHFRKMQPGHTQ
jgi:hypothetical protein